MIPWLRLTMAATLLALAGCGQAPHHPPHPKHTPSPRPRLSRPIPLGIANYGLPETTPALLSEAGASGWLGGSQIDFATQMEFRRHFLPSLNVGKTLMKQGGCSGDCTNGGTLNLPWLDVTAARAVRSTVSPGGYYVVGNEVNDSFSDDVAPTQAGYGAQLDAWVAAIRKYDPRARFVGPNFTPWTDGSPCGDGSPEQQPICFPWGPPRQWWAQFRDGYRAAHGGSNPPFAYMSIHAYPKCETTSPADTAAVDEYSKQVAADGYPAAVWITEAALCFDQPAATPLSIAQQRDVTAFVNAHRTDPRVGRFYYFTQPFPGYDAKGAGLSFRSVFNANGSVTELGSALMASGPH